MSDQFYTEEGYVETGYFVYIADAEALLPAIATKITVLTQVSDFFIPMDVLADLTAVGEATLAGSSDIDAVFNTAIDADVIRSTGADFVFAADLAIDLERIRTTDVALIAETDISASADRTRLFDIDITGEFLFNTTSERIRTTSSNILSVFDQTADAIRVRTGDASSDSQFDFAADPNRILGAFANETAEFDLEATTGFLRETAASFEVTAFLSTIVVVEGIPTRPGVSANVEFDGAVEINSQFNTLITGDRIRTADSSKTAGFDIAATTGFLIEPVLQLDAIATKLTAAGRISDFFIPMDVNAALTAEPTHIKGLAASIESNISITADSVRIRTADADFEFGAEVNCLANHIRALSATLESVATVSSVLGKVEIASVTMPAIFSLSGEITQLTITQYIYTIPRENRTIRVRR
jgi:hypothetical protein